ncbi:Protein of unknown function [Pyronema omphalodes CBS 100304]|uniref:Uncharacterized protein n=1 Tax=Pyronema omphalodes (strain CBS 100304) TaxID=1076935 RepID=U4LFA2_PYROM|nr:Protein of unknown function [Pyronema omphalodes CBS 100304]
MSNPSRESILLLDCCYDYSGEDAGYLEPSRQTLCTAGSRRSNILICIFVNAFSRYPIA